MDFHIRHDVWVNVFNVCIKCSLQPELTTAKLASMFHMQRKEMVCNILSGTQPPLKANGTKRFLVCVKVKLVVTDASISLFLRPHMATFRK